MPRSEQDGPIGEPDTSAAEAKLISAIRTIIAKATRQQPTPVTIAAQENGTVITNEHRILNFQGAGVTVSDEPSLRRTNIQITGTLSAGNTIVVASSNVTRARTLWNGSTNITPPSGWEAVSYAADASSPWVNAAASGGAIWSSASPLSATEQALFRQQFTLPAGQIVSASLVYNANDASQGVWVNGTLVPTTVRDPATSPATVAVDVTLLVAGSSANVLAMWGRNTLQVGAFDAFVGFALTITMNVAGLDTRYQLLSEKDQNSGYAGLDGTGLVPDGELADSGTPDGTTFLRGDRTWASASTNSVVVKEIDGTPNVSADTIRFTNGTVTNDGGGQVTVDVSGILHMPYVKAQDQKTQNTAGGTATSGSFATRTLNTLVTDTDSIASLSSNQVTLPAGTYDCYARAPAVQCGRHQIRVQDVTHSTTLILGSNAFASAAGGAQDDSFAFGRFTIASTSAIELQHRVQVTTATFGFGNEANFGTEVYGSIEFKKVG